MQRYVAHDAHRSGCFNSVRAGAVNIDRCAGEARKIEFNQVSEIVPEISGIGADAAADPLARETGLEGIGLLRAQRRIADVERFMREVVVERGLADAARRAETQIGIRW